MKEEQKEEDNLRRRGSFLLPTQKHCSSSQVDYGKLHYVSKTLLSKVAATGLNMKVVFEVSPETFQNWKLFDKQRQFRSHQI